MHEHLRAGLRQDLIGPVAPAYDLPLLLRRHPPAEALPQRAGGGQWVPRGNRAGHRFDAPPRLLAVQHREEPRDLHAGIIQVDGVCDREQARPGHAPRDHDQRVRAASDHLGQVRDGGLARERLQDADLPQDAPCGGLRPCELHEEILAEGRTRRLPHRVVLTGRIRDVDRQPAQFRHDGPQCLRDGGRRGPAKPSHNRQDSRAIFGNDMTADTNPSPGLPRNMPVPRWLAACWLSRDTLCPVSRKMANLTHLGERLGETNLIRREPETSRRVCRRQNTAGKNPGTNGRQQRRSPAPLPRVTRRQPSKPLPFGIMNVIARTGAADFPSHSGGSPPPAVVSGLRATWRRAGGSRNRPSGCGWR